MKYINAGKHLLLFFQAETQVSKGEDLTKKI